MSMYIPFVTFYQGTIYHMINIPIVETHSIYLDRLHSVLLETANLQFVNPIKTWIYKCPEITGQKLDVLLLGRNEEELKRTA